MGITVDKIKSYATLAVAIIAILGWFTTIITNRVGTKKDVEQLQKDVTEIKGDVKFLSTSQIDGGKENAATQEFIKQHMILHESLH
jgi:hypothetical protein